MNKMSFQKMVENEKIELLFTKELQPTTIQNESTIRFSIAVSSPSNRN